MVLCGTKGPFFGFLELNRVKNIGGKLGSYLE